MSYLVNYGDHSEFVGDILVRPGITKVKKADVKGAIEKGLPKGIAVCDDLGDVRWEEFPPVVKRIYASDSRYRQYLGVGDALDPSIEMRQAIEAMNRAALSGAHDGVAAQGDESESESEPGSGPNDGG